MWSFQYKHGDRPLEGYTIERAAGRGGFGEVYYARSDSGREVALKAVTGYEQIELRGIGQCMNLKSPHLVSIFDVKHNEQGKPFVIMEFVSGPSLRQLLDESPGGLGEQKSAFFLREIAKGLQYLHDCGIVHRDLKPGNIFYENGYVKIGDYGLSKAIATSQHVSQTVQVGTVHYMAPEIGMGKYDRSIDIYALGALLYEMLTGMVPYVGASPTEVLMKHLSAEPDCKGIKEPFATVIKKAMAKDPVQRYQSVQEMVEGIFGSEHVRQSVSVFSPDSLSMVAGKVAVGAGVGGGGGGSSGPTGSPAYQHDVWQKVGSFVDQLGGHVAGFGRNMGAGAPGAASPPLVNDPLDVRHRVTIAAGIAFLTSMIATISGGNAKTSAGGATFFFAILSLVGIGLGSDVFRRVLMPKMAHENPGFQKLMTALLIGLITSVLTLVPMLSSAQYASQLGMTLAAILIPLFIVDMRKWTTPDRIERVQFWGPAIYAFILSAICASIFGGRNPTAGFIAAGATVIIQLLAPWDPTFAARRKAAGVGSSYIGPIPGVPDVNAPTTRAQVRASANREDGVRIGLAIGQDEHVLYQSCPSQYQFSPISTGKRLAWLGPFIGGLTLGLTLLIVAGTQEFRQSEDFAAAVTFGVSGLVMALISLVRASTKRFYGWWHYLLRPILFWACVTSIVGCGVVLGNVPLRGDESIPCIFGIVFPGILLVTSLFLCGKTKLEPGTSNTPVAPSNYRRTNALVFACLFFPAGLHRMYVGRVASGLLWLFTFGLFGIGQLIDLIMILTGDFKDAEGRPVRNWSAPSSAAPAPQPPPIPPPIGEVAQNISQLGGRIGQVVNDAMRTVSQSMKVAVVDARNHARTARAMVRRRRPRRGGLMAAFAAMLLFISSILAVGLALDVPGMVDAGFPTKSWSAQIRNAIRVNIGGFDESGGVPKSVVMFGQNLPERDESAAFETSTTCPTDEGAKATAATKDFDQVITEKFGTVSLISGYREARWVPLARSAGLLLSAMLGVLGLTILLFARRDAGVFHIFRAMLGVGFLCGSFLTLHATLHASEIWAKYAGRNPSEALEAFVGAFSSKQIFNFLAAFFVAILMLSWPPKKEKVVLA